MTRTRIKICGITRPEDAQVAVAQGVDALGLVFYASSSRAVDALQAQAIVAQIPAFVTVVALFVDETAANIERILDQVPVDLLQFHGSESAAFCQQFKRPYIKALRVRPEMDIAAQSQQYASARGILLDAWQEGVPGGTGKSFDWQLAEGLQSRSLILAGGLDSANVGKAISQLRPWSVDVSGGVESAPGVKDQQKIKDFIAAAAKADQQLSGCTNEQ